jgi:hypothetical protein
MIAGIPDLRAGAFGRLGAALLLIVGLICSAYAAEQISVPAHSGEELPCHVYYRVDANGKEWPVTIRFTSRPRNGTVATRAVVRPVAVNGQTKSVHAVRVVYQSTAGFVGQDSFTYRRVTADPTDPDSGKEYTVAVTVR